MRQVTLRLTDELANQLKAAASERDRSVNTYAAAVLAAATNPDFADSESVRLRERLARAGLLSDAPPVRSGRPAGADVRRARAAAGKGRSLAELVSEERR